MASNEQQDNLQAPVEEDFAWLESAINYQFKDRLLLGEAVTHTTGKKEKVEHGKQRATGILR